MLVFDQVGVNLCMRRTCKCHFMMMSFEFCAYGEPVRHSKDAMVLPLPQGRMLGMSQAMLQMHRVLCF